MGTIAVLAVLAGIVALIVRNMIRSRKSGKSLPCGCDCGHCGGKCGH
ncbi:MAG: FeoB-associated Cys-rich membrane protein [Lachnospiraceae bacterium]|nr:FeoB-associated Cys-rich membrane protein [Lachnospiraceae bacterium]